MNRERNFWVYKHPLFHRDRPHDLHLLRRRTCPGVDGRKVRPEVELRNLEAGFRSPTNVSMTADTTSDSDAASEHSEPKKRQSTSSRKQSDASLSSMTEDISEFAAPLSTSTFMVRDNIEIEKEPLFETVHVGGFASTGDQYMRGPSRLVSPVAKMASPADIQEQSLLVSKVARQLEQHAKRATISMGKGAQKKATPVYVSNTMTSHSLTYDDEVEIFDSARGCVVERSSSKMDTFASDDFSDDESATVVSFNDSEVSAPASKYVVTAPVQDANVINEVLRNLLNASRDVNRDPIIPIAQFCMKTDPQDPTLGEKAIQLMSVHGDLAQEFCRYKIALSPNDHNASFMKEIFEDESGDTVRVFKTFVLNSLRDLVRQSKSAAWSESGDLTKCYDVWFSAVASSA